MNQKISELEPKVVWGIFDKITEIPRCSGREQKLQNWVKKWADENKIQFKSDDVGNILLTKDAKIGFEGYPTIVYQVHQDMVCEKLSSSKHNFENDPIETKIEGNYIVANGTTLGADNGIGISLAMSSLIDPEASRYGKIEVLMTVEEETTFKGASNVKRGFFTGKRMVNLDSEETGIIITESAGGGSTHYEIHDRLVDARNLKGFSITVDGLLGGHSGVDIHQNRANAIKLVSSYIRKLSDIAQVRIAHFEGGTVANAIPRYTRCDFLTEDKKQEMKGYNSIWAEGIRKEYPLEKTMKITFSEKTLKKSFTRQKTNNLTKLIDEIPQGVISWSKNIEGLVQTSNNLGIIRTEEDKIKLTLLSRGSDSVDLEKLRARLREIGEKCDVVTTQSSPSTGWSTNSKSSFVKFVAEEYRDLMGNEPKITGIHGGLECSAFSKLDPEIQIVSIGATLESPHSPQERLEISGVNVVWNLIKSMSRDIIRESKF